MALYTVPLTITSPLLAGRRFCPRSNSLLATHNATHRTRVIPIRCKCWSCDYCAPLNSEKLIDKVLSGKPTHFITLTTRALDGEDAKTTNKRCRPQIARLLSAIRKRWGPIEAAIILELTKKDHPHYHLCCRCNFIPQHWLSDIWMSLTGAFIVDIRRIRNPKKCATYVSKYCSKTARRTALHKIGRIQSFTTNYLIREQSNPRESGWICSLIKRHPIEVVNQQPAGFEVSYSEGFFELRPSPEQLNFLAWSQPPPTPVLQPG